MSLISSPRPSSSLREYLVRDGKKGMVASLFPANKLFYQIFVPVLDYTHTTTMNRSQRGWVLVLVLGMWPMRYVALARRTRYVRSDPSGE